MKAPFVFSQKNLIFIGLILLAAGFSLAVGMSGLFLKSTISPLIVGGAILAAVIFLFLLLNRVWALCAAIFVALLPDQVLALNPISYFKQYPILFPLLLACVPWVLSLLNRRQKIVLYSTNLLMLAFLTWSTISLFWSPNLLLGRQTLVVLCVGFILPLLMVNEIDSKKALNELMMTLAICGWVLVLSGIGTILANGYTPGTRLKVLGINENEFGLLLLLTMVGVFWQAADPEGRSKTAKSWMASIFLLISIVFIAMSGSRGSMISLVVMLLTFLIWKPTRIWGALGLGIMALGGILASQLFLTIVERFLVMDGDTLLGGREILWLSTWNLILDHTWLGVGIGNARSLLGAYVNVIGEKAPTHNPILQVWAETGLPGILLYLGILFSAIGTFFRKINKTRRDSSYGFWPYYCIIGPVFLGYLFSWIKGGGAEYNFSYFLMLSLLLIPTIPNSEQKF